MLQDGNIHIGINLMSVTADRSTVVDFTIDKTQEEMLLYVKTGMKNQNASQILALVQFEGWLISLAIVLVGIAIMAMVTLALKQDGTGTSRFSTQQLVQKISLEKNATFQFSSS